MSKNFLLTTMLSSPIRNRKWNLWWFWMRLWFSWWTRFVNNNTTSALSVVVLRGREDWLNMDLCHWLDTFCWIIVNVSSPQKFVYIFFIYHQVSIRKIWFGLIFVRNWCFFIHLFIFSVWNFYFFFLYPLFFWFFFISFGIISVTILIGLC